MTWNQNLEEKIPKYFIERFLTVSSFLLYSRLDLRQGLRGQHIYTRIFDARIDRDVVSIQLPCAITKSLDFQRHLYCMCVQIQKALICSIEISRHANHFTDTRCKYLFSCVALWQLILILLKLYFKLRQ